MANRFDLQEEVEIWRKRATALQRVVDRYEIGGVTTQLEQLRGAERIAVHQAAEHKKEVREFRRALFVLHEEILGVMQTISAKQMSRKAVLRQLQKVARRIQERIEFPSPLPDLLVRKEDEHGREILSEGASEDGEKGDEGVVTSQIERPRGRAHSGVKTRSRQSKSQANRRHNVKPRGRIR